tara:strand:- start:294 stop:1205 length:912 start_codon:yes stop_codon:yes gene_type:complete
MLKEVIEALCVKADGIYLDCTFGRGGHSSEILKLLGDKGKLIAFDRDLDAVNVGKKIADKRFEIEHCAFSEIDKILKKKDIKKLDGILMDLGISSPQIDEARRGFSFRFDAILDMRMDQTQGITAAEVVNTYEEKDLIYALKTYGEEKFAKKIVKAIIEYREINGPITMTLELAELIKKVVPQRNLKKNPATKTFQALRILVNKEMEELENTLPTVFNYLKPKARLVVISFHSLEDRIVKNYTKHKIKTDFIPKNIPIRASEIKLAPFKIAQKMITPSPHEIERNPRSRSAKLRVIEKVREAI